LNNFKDKCSRSPVYVGSLRGNMYTRTIKVTAFFRYATPYTCLSLVPQPLPYECQVALEICKNCRGDRYGRRLLVRPVEICLCRRTCTCGLPRLSPDIFHSLLQVFWVLCPGLGVCHLFGLASRMQSLARSAPSCLRPGATATRSSTCRSRSLPAWCSVRKGLSRHRLVPRIRSTWWRDHHGAA
jgi:hypothetical protein